ncbi:hypothetical protein CW304_32840 [Bacillus sp. UFRGS-B20]|nr:hypothetical protein CW304_32840 [Bacillus sp. UFRGS-B20]
MCERRAPRLSWSRYSASTATLPPRSSWQSPPAQPRDRRPSSDCAASYRRRVYRRAKEAVFQLFSRGCSGAYLFNAASGIVASGLPRLNRHAVTKIKDVLFADLLGISTVKRVQRADGQRTVHASFMLPVPKPHEPP